MENSAEQQRMAKAYSMGTEENERLAYQHVTVGPPAGV